jgi:hypothetical protein
LDLDELNKKIANNQDNVDCLKGLEVIAEALVYKIYDLYGRNLLLSMLYQVGAGPGDVIAKRLKEKYNKEDFAILESLELLVNELKEFYSIKVRKIETVENTIRIEIDNYCFLREPSQRREKLRPGTAFCRVNKGYFETAFKKLIGNKIKKVEINFLEDDQIRNICVEELIFHLSDQF